MDPGQEPRGNGGPATPGGGQRYPRQPQDETDELSQQPGGQGAGAHTPGPQHMGGYSITAPDQSRRLKLQAAANKELEDLEKWKEANKCGPINLTPIQLGGSISQSEARLQQQRKQQLSKYQQRAKKEEYDRKRREQEEAELQKMKAIQREKAEKLEETRRQQEEQRRAQLQTGHYHTNQQFLQRMDPNRYSANSFQTYSFPQPSASWAKKEEYDRKRREQEEAELQKMKAIQREKADKLEETRRQQEEQRRAQLQTGHYHTNQQFLQRMESNRYSANSFQTWSSPQPPASWNNLLEGKEPEMDEARQRQLQEDHRRTNNTFLDKLEVRSQLGENSPSASLGLPAKNDLSQHDTKCAEVLPNLYNDQEDQKYCVNNTEEEDYQCSLMKLQTYFPHYEKDVLETLLQECNGDHKNVIQLLL